MYGVCVSLYVVVVYLIYVVCVSLYVVVAQLKYGVWVRFDVVASPIYGVCKLFCITVGYSECCLLLLACIYIII